MIRAIAYRLQERRFGEFKPSTQRLLDRVCEGRADVGRKRISDKRVSAGTVLIREWGSVSHRVMVLDHGVVYGGRRYRSLSEVAGVITGARWSGPLFFGLKRRAAKIAHEKSWVVMAAVVPCQLLPGLRVAVHLQRPLPTAKLGR